MLFLKKRPKTKKLHELECLDVNLIENTPLEYAYLLPNSHRVIQKESKESIKAIIQASPHSLEYVKLGSDKDFVLTSSIPEFKTIFARSGRKKALGGLIQNAIGFLILTVLIIYDRSNIDDLSSPLGIGLILFLIGSTSVYIFRLSKYRIVKSERK